MGATQYLGYAKVLRLASPKSSPYEELITYCTTDIERIRDGVILYVQLFGKCLTTIKPVSLLKYFINTCIHKNSKLFIISYRTYSTANCLRCIFVVDCEGSSNCWTYRSSVGVSNIGKSKASFKNLLYILIEIVTILS